MKAQRVMAAATALFALGFSATKVYGAKPDVDQKAMSILQENNMAVSGLNSVSGTETFHSEITSSLNVSIISTFKYERPNFAWMTSFQEFIDASGKLITNLQSWTVSDGNNYVSYYPGGRYDASKQKYVNSYDEKSVAEDGSNMLLDGAFNGFFSVFSRPLGRIKESIMWGGTISLKYLGKRNWRGQSCDVVKWQGYNPAEWMSTGPAPLATTDIHDFYFDHAHLLVRVTNAHAATPKTVFSFTDYAVKINPPIAPSDFAIHIPADAERNKDRGYVNASDLLAKGSNAPDFTLHSSPGKPFKLSDYRGKAVLLIFCDWSGANSEPIIRFGDRGVYHPLFDQDESLAKKFSANLIMIAINPDNENFSVKSWFALSKKYRDIIFSDDTPAEQQSIAKLYKVLSTPTQYLIGENGKIVAAIEGYSGSNDGVQDAIKDALGDW